MRAAAGGSERRMVRRTAASVRRAATSALRQRSRAGDAIGTQDAIQSLDVLRQTGQLGFFARLKASWTTWRALRRSLRTARRAAKRGDLQRAYENIAVVAERDGDSRRVRRATQNLYQRSLSYAWRAARAGDSQSAYSALEFAAQLAPARTAFAFDREAERVMKRAAERGIPRLAREATRAYRRGQVDHAVALVREARMLQQTTGVVPGRSARRSLERTAALLGPRLTAPAATPTPVSAPAAGQQRTAVDIMTGRGQ
jgi:hypothetical protein